jgi:hypothetical protein
MPLPSIGPIMSAGRSDVSGGRPARWWCIAVAILAFAFLLVYLPGRTRIPPLIESDYCYLLIAADHLYEGHGPTAPLPVAPFQPWTWQADGGFLTQWPIGYPLLVCAVRWVFGVLTVQACRGISVVACAAALVGWFIWVKRGVPHGVTGLLLAAVAAGCSVSTASLINPSTDALLAALLPYVLLLVPQGNVDSSRDRNGTWFAIAGLGAGALFWIRYAAIFVPISNGLYLLVEHRRRRCGLLNLVVYGACAALPIIALLLVNRVFGEAPSLQAQLNLGHKLAFDFSLARLATVWWKFTDLGFYDYHWYAHWVYALWPAGVVLVALVFPPARRALATFFATPAATLSGIVVLTLLCMLVGVTVVFGDKFDYVQLDRYYTPAKPLYFVLFVAPLMLIPRRIVRIALCAALVVACSWTAQQEWSRPYRRWLAANREITPYGQWGYCFSPNAGGLYKWLSAQRTDNLIVLSNFHDYVALETKIPAIPVPKDMDTLNVWINRICAVRRMTSPRVLFVLDPDNRRRDYYLRPVAEIIRTFELTQRADPPETISAQVYEYGEMLAHGNTER